MTEDERWRRFVSSGDEEFGQDWEILESEENSDEDQANRDNSPDSEILRETIHPSLGHGNRSNGRRPPPPHSGETESKMSARQALRDVAAQFGFGNGKTP